MSLILFLDFDDVICLNQPFGGYDVLRIFTDAARDSLPVPAKDKLWSELFNVEAIRHLKQVHEEFSLRYVLSTSWRWLLDKDAMVQTLHFGGLSFVAEHLHSDWSTPLISKHAHRSVEIKGWLAKHTESASAWVVLDDELSGTGFSSWTRDQRKFVALCQAGVGLQKTELRQLQQALAVRRVLLK